MIKNLLIGFIITLINFSSYSQSRWTHFYFGTEDTWGRDLKEYYDKGYLMTGQYGSGYDNFIWLLKTDINGDVLWQKTFGESNSIMSFYFLDVNNSGDIFLSGETSYYDPYRDPLIMKLNACGEKEWCRVFNTPNHFDYAHSIVATDDGGCAVILRYTGIYPPQTDRICLAKFDYEGNLLWKQCYNSLDSNLISEDSRSLLKSPDKGFLITGVCDYYDFSHHLHPKQYYIKTDSLGNLQWETVFKPQDNSNGGDAWTTYLNPDSSYYYSSVSHYYFESDFSSPALIKLDLEGDLVGIYDVINGYNYGGLTYAQFINDSALVASCVFGNTQDDIVTLSVIIDTLGNIYDSLDLGPRIREKVLKLTYDNKPLYFYNVLQNDQLDIYLRKLNQNLEDDTIYTRPLTYDSLCPYQIVSDTIVPDDCGLIVSVEEQGGMEAEGHGGMEIWPNPAQTIVNCQLSTVDCQGDLTLVVYDIFGREVQMIIVPDGKEEFHINVESYPLGVYMAVLKQGVNLVASKKFVVAR